MKIITHSGSFQADDIFAVAILSLVVGEAEVVRTRDQTIVDTGDYVVDVGMVYDPLRNRFDHHQPGGAGERANGIPYASCGLVWKEFGEKLTAGKEEAYLIDIKLMQSLDALDNGVAIADYRFKDVRTYSVVDFLYSYRTSLHESEEELYSIFINLVVIAKDLLLREIKKAKIVIESEAKVREIYELSTDRRILVLSEDLPWGRVVKDKQDVMFVVYPRSNGQWGVRVVSDIGFVARRSLPSLWGGKRDKELQDITGVLDAVFCHRALFMVIAESKEGAMALAEIALNA
jgi:uncharacterized UPF0160 family protein